MDAEDLHVGNDATRLYIKVDHYGDIPKAFDSTFGAAIFMDTDRDGSDDYKIVASLRGHDYSKSPSPTLPINPSPVLSPTPSPSPTLIPMPTPSPPPTLTPSPTPSISLSPKTTLTLSPTTTPTPKPKPSWYEQYGSWIAVVILVMVVIAAYLYSRRW